MWAAISSGEIYLENFGRFRTDMSSVKVASEYKTVPLFSAQFKILAAIDFGDNNALIKTLVSNTRRIELLIAI